MYAPIPNLLDVNVAIDFSKKNHVVENAESISSYIAFLKGKEKKRQT